MSRFVFTSRTQDGTPVKVAAGWDHPLGYFFLDIYRIPDDDDPLFSCLDQEGVFQVQSTEPWEAKLQEFGIEAPPDFWERVNKKEGNLYFEYPKS